jgi:GT2 family glycosyltransferase
VPTHARPELLRGCLSALAEAVPPPGGFEVVVVDDGSPEPVDAVVADFAAELNLTLHRQPNTGPAAARNAGAHLATAPLLAFTDDDCTPAPGWLVAIAAAAARHPQALLGGETINGVPGNPFAEASQHIVDHLRVAESRQPPFFASNNLAAPAGPFRALGGFDPGFARAAAEDRDLCERWAASGRPLQAVPGALVRHHHHLGLVSFWRQHYDYGRGAYRYHRKRAERARGRLRLAPLAFYRSLLARPLVIRDRRKAGTLIGLLALSQLANAAGFTAEWLDARRSAPSRPR